jgi:hypothetical protein
LAAVNRLSGHGGAGLNIVFADAPFQYLVGVGWAAGAKNPPSQRC